MDLSRNQLCGLDYAGRGTHTAEGITAISDALRVNGSLTKLALNYDNLDDVGKDAIRKAVEGREGFDLQL